MMRDLDRRECEAAGLDPMVALEQSKVLSDGTYQEFYGTEMLCEWGWRLDSFLCQSASVWCLSFDAASNHRIHFARESRRKLDGLLLQFTTLRCEVWERHDVAMRWLGWLGFKPESLRNYKGALFIVMKRER